MLERIRKALRPHQWKITWALFAAPIVCPLAIYKPWETLALCALLTGVALWAFCLDKLRKWLDAE